ncbi:hypothetical protein [Rosenbergiella collisarenosi]|uniref:hypothetical protein n=1 Tax=Rosenbergiella collisarenosi TaxID=1544695 RepID=UPI001F4E086A|nr:hypothetical protein [Rosenbergiella collisarenosi]
MAAKTPPESPIEWCQRMQDNAKDGAEAMTYFSLKERWVGIIAEANKLRSKQVKNQSP